MWWWFRKREHKRKKPSDDKWASLAASLKISFFQVREDINHLTDSDSHQHEKIIELYSRMHKLESRIDQMILAINIHQNYQSNHQLPHSLPLPEKTEEYHPSHESTLHLIENLTDVQKNILVTLAQISKEIHSGWISLKELSSELYPNKSYNAVRTMMSEYTDKLLDLRLVDKKRKGREVLVSLTEKTKHLQHQQQKESIKPHEKNHKKEEKHE